MVKSYTLSKEERLSRILTMLLGMGGAIGTILSVIALITITVFCAGGLIGWASYLTRALLIGATVTAGVVSVTMGTLNNEIVSIFLSARRERMEQKLSLARAEPSRPLSGWIDS